MARGNVISWGAIDGLILSNDIFSKKKKVK